MTRIILTCLFLITICSCSKTNLLTYNQRKYCGENNYITNDKTFQLSQNIYYNNPKVIDEEYIYYLFLTFSDTSAAKSKRVLDLQTDTLIVKCKYGITTIWNWGDKSNVIVGQVEILKWNKDEVILRENIIATDSKKNETKKFIGTRTFKRKDVGNT